MKAAVLTIGNEVSSGQILNSNAAWISQELEALKVEVLTQLTVQDTDSQILDALNFIAKHAEVIIVTGGLGPTKDDLTRHSVNSWLGENLEFDQNSWQSIVDRLGSFGVPVAESNKQQCYFPKNSTILKNEAGTANAFYYKKDHIHLWCLPGPPREIKRIWSDHISSFITKNISQGLTGLSLMLWQCLGKSESALGEIVEEAIEGSSLSSGYRPHIPYVEVKIWSPDNELKENQKFLDKLDTAIKPWVVAKDKEDLARNLCDKLITFESIRVFDFSSAGILAERLGSLHRKSDGTSLPMNILSQWDNDEDIGDVVLKTLELAEPEVMTLCLGQINKQFEWDLGLAFDGNIKTQVLKLPFKRSSSKERMLKFQVEQSLHTWTSLINDLKGQVIN